MIAAEMTCTCSAYLNIDTDTDDDAAWLMIHRFSQAHVRCGFIMPAFGESEIFFDPELDGPPDATGSGTVLTLPDDDDEDGCVL